MCLERRATILWDMIMNIMMGYDRRIQEVKLVKSDGR